MTETNAAVNAVRKFATIGDPGKPKPKVTINGSLRQISSQSLLRDMGRVIGVFNPTRLGFDRKWQMLDDPTVWFSQALLRAPVTDDNFCVYSEDSKISALVDWQLRKLYPELPLAASMAIPFGHAMMEKVWTGGPIEVVVDDKSGGTTSKLNLPQAWTIERVKGLDPRNFVLLFDRAKDAWAGIQGPSIDEGKTVDIGTERSILWSFLAPLVHGRLTGLSLLEKQYGPWWEKQATNLFCDRYFEKKADGQYKAHAPAEIDGPNGKKIDGFEFVQNALMALKNGEAITLPGEMDDKGNRLVDVALLQDDKRGDMYHPRLEYLDLQILRAALIADRAGSAGRGSGIGTGEAAVHFDVLQMLLEEIIKDWLKVLQEQVVNPVVLYNFGEEALRSSRTRVQSKGISNWMRDLYRVVLQQMTQFEVALKDGKVVRAYEYIDFVGVCEALKVPLKPADQLGSLAHTRNDEALGLKPPAGNPGDTNVKGKGGNKKKDGTGGGQGY